MFSPARTFLCIVGQLYVRLLDNYKEFFSDLEVEGLRGTQRHNQNGELPVVSSNQEHRARIN